MSIKMLAWLPPPSTSPGSRAESVSPAPSVDSDISEISLDDILQKKPEGRLCLDDLNVALEMQRSRSQQQSRCMAVKSAQKRLIKIYARARQNRHGPTDSMSLPSFSRPQTRTESHNGENLRVQSAVTLPVSASKSIVSRTRPNPKICLRVQSAMSHNSVDDPAVSSLCRQCCEVLGPRTCHQCAKIQRRQKEMLRYESAFPGFLVADDDITTAIVLKKYIPNKETNHIQDLIAEGTITPPNFKEALVRLKLETARKRKEDEAQQKAIQQAASKARDNYTFFSSIRDLNQKIVSGHASKKISGLGGIAKPNFLKESSGLRSESKMTFTELMCPMFVSPKRLKPQSLGYLAHYEPPLLPSVSQNVEPAFFAGSDTPYKLPDRLPDQLIDTD